MTGVDVQEAISRAHREERARVIAALARRAPASAAQDELHFQQFLAANCFGDHVARAGIGVSARELGVLAQDVAA